jgi:hypothetical protein
MGFLRFVVFAHSDKKFWKNLSRLLSLHYITVLYQLRSSEGFLLSALIKLRNVRCEPAKVLTRTVESLMMTTTAYQLHSCTTVNYIPCVAVQGWYRIRRPIHYDHFRYIVLVLI